MIDTTSAADLLARTERVLDAYILQKIQYLASESWRFLDREVRKPDMRGLMIDVAIGQDGQRLAFRR